MPDAFLITPDPDRASEEHFLRSRSRAGSVGICEPQFRETFSPRSPRSCRCAESPARSESFGIGTPREIRWRSAGRARVGTRLCSGRAGCENHAGPRCRDGRPLLRGPVWPWIIAVFSTRATEPKRRGRRMGFPTWPTNFEDTYL